MDVPRKNASRNRLIRRSGIVTGLLVAAGAATFGLSRLKPAAPSVEFSSVWPDAVKRGTMIEQRRGLGTLVPEEVLIIPSVTAGRVQRILMRPGTPVRHDTVILELSNEELEVAASEAEWQLKAAEATMADLRVKLATSKLEQQSRAAQVKADYTKAKLAADRDQELHKNGLTAELTARTSKATADELAGRTEIEAKRLEIMEDSIKAQVQAQEVQIARLRDAYQLKKRQVEQLQVRAGVQGVLQQLTVEVGQQVAAGTQLAKAAQPTKLKAELKIAETQAKDIVIGQKVEIDTRNGVIPGRVSRIDPAVLNGTRTIDVRLEGALPPGAVPDLSVDGVVEIAKLDDVVYMGRPVSAQADSTISVFKIDPATGEANRVPVRLGRMSVNTVEVKDGLKVGDQVILSDMSQWDAHSRVKLQGYRN